MEIMTRFEAKDLIYATKLLVPDLQMHHGKKDDSSVQKKT